MPVTLLRLRQVVPLLRWGATPLNHEIAFQGSFQLLDLSLPLRHIWPGLDWCPVSEEVGHPRIPCHLHGILCVIYRIMLLEQIRITKKYMHIYLPLFLSPPRTEERMLQSGTYLQLREHRVGRIVLALAWTAFPSLTTLPQMLV